MRALLLCATAAVLAPAAAGAAPPGPTVAGSAEVAGAPPPDQAGGVRVPEADDGPGLRAIARGVLWVPRWALEVPFAPLRGGAYLYDRYQLRERLRQVWPDDRDLVAVYPVALVETGFGLNAGLRAFHRDLFGRGEALGLRAGYGGRSRQVYTASLDSGARLGRRLAVEVIGSLEVQPRERFYGLGDGALVDAATVEAPLDPLVDDTAVATRFGQTVARVSAGLDADLGGDLWLTATGAFTVRDFGLADREADEVEMTAVYQPIALPGYRRGLSNLYGELELRWDTRRPCFPWVPAATPSTGWRLAGFAGLAAGLGDDPSAYGRWGLDLQRYLPLGFGDRVLVLRVLVEGVTGALAEVPFVDLPRLGGPLLLRGYPRDRFRDRTLTLATVEYQYPVSRHVAGHLFVDAGRVWRRAGELLGAPRLGFGAGVQLHRGRTFLLRAQVASSIDGGLLASLSLDPVFDPRLRVERK